MKALSIADVTEGVVLARVEIAAPPERVWKAISTDELAKWWGSDDLYRTTKHTVDLRAGGAYKSEGIGREGNPFHVSGTILEVDPPNRLVQTWQPSWDAGPPSTVTWMLEPIATGTRLTVRHSGFTNPTVCEDHAKGWERVLAWLGGYTDLGGPAKPAQYFVSKLLPPRPTFMTDMTKDERDVMIAHSNYWRGLLGEGKAIAFGPVGGPTGGYGLGILKAADEAALKAMQAEDPAIKSERGFSYDNAPLVTLVF